MKTLYIHIGTSKTGTTSLQTFCRANADILERMGYTYPIFPYSYPNVPDVRNGHFLVGIIRDENKKRCKEEEERIFQEGMERVSRLFESFDSVVLSDESIWRNMDVERKSLWREMKQWAEAGGFKIKVIVYLRRQDKFLCSLWNQKVKGTYMSQVGFEDYVKQINKKIRFDYYDKLERIAQVIGKENIIVRRFENDKFLGGNIYSDFLQAIGINQMEDFQVTTEVRNRGLSGNASEIKRILNALPQMKDAEHQKFIRDVLLECSAISEKNYPCEMFSKEEAQAFLEEYQEGNDRIAREYLKEEGTSLFDDSFKDVPKWQPDNLYMREDLIHFIGLSIMYLIDENQKLKQRLESDEKTREDTLAEVSDKIKKPIHTVARIVLRKRKD